MPNWNRIRKDFPITKRFTYLDHASASPMPKPVYQAVCRFYDELTGFADFSWNRWISRREEVREKVAKFIHARADEITFTTSTSHGMNLIAELLANEGAVLTDDLEFPATTVPWIHRKVKLDFIESENGAVPLSSIKNRLGKAKTILTSFVQYKTGFRQNLEALGQMKGDRYLVVNATQGFGYLPINVKTAKIDFLATNSYKWMMAGYGGGVLYMNKKWIRKFKPKSAGWRSVVQPELFDNRKAILKNEASRYEFGCPPFPHIFSIGASLDYFNEIGLSNITSRINALTGFLKSSARKLNIEILSPDAPSERSGIVILKVKNPEKLTNQFLKRRIYVSARGGGIRVAPHFYNNESDLSFFLTNLKEMMQ